MNFINTIELFGMQENAWSDSLCTKHRTKPILSYARWDREDNRFIVINNLSDKSYDEYYINLPEGYPRISAGSLSIAFNTDRQQYGGSGLFEEQQDPDIKTYGNNKQRFKVKLAAFSTLVLKENNLK
jgi:1,4-alpha-glucan branching enzyme